MFTCSMLFMVVAVLAIYACVDGKPRGKPDVYSGY